MKRSIENTNGHEDEQNGSPRKSKPPVNGKRRIFTLIGDASDHEDNYSDTENFVENLNQFNKDEFLLSYENNNKEKCKETFNISIPCILKEIGDKILKNKIVRDKYKGIKSKLLPQDKIQDYEEMDDQLGRGWDILFTHFFLWSWRERRKACENYFSLNKEKINERCNDDETYQKLTNNGEKGEYYLLKIALHHFCKKMDIPEERIKIREGIGKFWVTDVDENSNFCKQTLKIYHEKDENKFNRYYKNEFENAVICDFRDEVQRLNQKIVDDPFRRQLTELVNLDFTKIEPGSFLARVLSSLKLDRDLALTSLYEMEIIRSASFHDKEVKEINWKTIKTYANETLQIDRWPVKFFQNKTELGNYARISENLSNSLKSDSYEIDSSEMKMILQAYFRGEEITDKNRVFLTKWKEYIELIFGIEVIRNSSALLTHAMFFDLLNKKDYTLENLYKKLPMAMVGAIAASSIFSHKMGKQNYDFREVDYSNYIIRNVAELTKRDQTILFDWLEENIINEIKELNLGIFDVDAEDDVSKLLTLQKTDEKLNFLDLTNCQRNAQISNEKTIIPFRLPYYSGILRLEWVGDLKKYNFKIIEITEVSAKVFYNLIVEWYSIHVHELNKEDKIRFDFALLKLKDETVPTDGDIKNNNDNNNNNKSVPDNKTNVAEVPVCENTMEVDDQLKSEVVTDEIKAQSFEINEMGKLTIRSQDSAINEAET